MYDNDCWRWDSFFAQSPVSLEITTLSNFQKYCIKSHDRPRCNYNISSGIQIPRYGSQKQGELFDERYDIFFVTMFGSDRAIKDHIHFW